MRKSQNTAKPRVLLVHPGTQHAPRLAAELHRRGLLHEFWSGFACGDDAPWLAFATAKMKSRLGGRICRGVPDRMIRCRAWLEWAALRRAGRGERGEDVFYERNRRFQESVPSGATAGAAAVVGFDTSSWILAQRCRRSGQPFILEQSVAHPAHKQRLLAEASRRFPDWAEREPERPARMLAAEKMEHDSADRIVVGSTYCGNTLAEEGIDPAKIVVNPYGVEHAAAGTFDDVETGKDDGILKFVLVGFLSLRKGIPLLLEAWSKAGLADAELVLAGGIREEHRGFVTAVKGVRYAGFVPRSALPGFLYRQDVCVLPSYSEGFAISLIEAMSAGLPLITSTHSGGPDMLTEGREGFVISPGDVDALVDRLRWFAAHRDKIPAMSQAAEEKAREFTWERYGERYEGMLRELCE